MRRMASSTDGTGATKPGCCTVRRYDGTGHVHGSVPLKASEPGHTYVVKHGWFSHPCFRMTQSAYVDAAG